MNKSTAIRSALLALAGTLGLSGAANATYFNTYFGFNYLGGQANVMDLTSVTYTGAAGSETFVLPDVMATYTGPLNPPNFAGLPDSGRSPSVAYGATFPENPNINVAAGGDGASTRATIYTDDLTVLINWDTTIPLLPTIQITSYTFREIGSSTDHVAVMDAPYTLGMIAFGSETIPGTPDTELGSFTGIPLFGDVYPQAGTGGLAGNLAANSQAAGFTTPTFLISFAAAEAAGGPVSAVPVPAAVWLFGSAIGLLGWMRRTRRS